MARFRKWCAGSVVAVLLVAAAPAMAVTASDPKGDHTDGDRNHDIVEVGLSEGGDELRFTVRVDGTVQAPSPAEELRVSFKVTPGELYTPGVSPQASGIRHVVVFVGQFFTYGVCRMGAFCYQLPDQPSTGSSSATFVVPKAYLDATFARRPMAGDYVADIVFSVLNTSLEVDAATLADFKLTTDSDPGTKLHLREDDALTAGGLLEASAPDASTPSTQTLFSNGTMDAEWSSGALDKPLKLGDLSTVLWLSTTTSSPPLADEDFRVELYSVAPAGTRTLVAERSESVSPTPGVTTNLFVTPGVPQRMPFQLLKVDGAPVSIPSGNKAVLRVAVSGFFVEESGPVLVYFDAKDHDSYLLAGKKPLPRPDKSKCPKDDSIQTGQVDKLPKPGC